MEGKNWCETQNYNRCHKLFIRWKKNIYKRSPKKRTKKSLKTETISLMKLKNI